MDAFTYYDMFASKGPEYLVVIAFLAMVFPFWRLLSSKSKPVPVRSEAVERIPAGVWFDSTHSWAFLDRDGSVRVGIDDFLTKLTGPLKTVVHGAPGSHVRRGDPLISLRNGNRELSIPAPVTGKLQKLNNREANVLSIDDQTSLVDAWLMKIDPDQWEHDQAKMVPGGRVGSWLRSEYSRMRDFMAFTLQKYGPEAQPVVLQDGGELAPEILADLHADIWKEFQTEFIDAVFEP